MNRSILTFAVIILIGLGSTIIGCGDTEKKEGHESHL